MTAPAELGSFYANRNVCVTGGAGFIGSHVTTLLASLGSNVTVLDDLSQGLRENLKDVARPVRLVEGSILDPKAVKDAMAGAEVVFHLAALVSVPKSVEEPERYYDVNAMGTLRVMEAARAAGVKRVVYSASSSAYGDSPALPKAESHVPEPLSPYATSKLSGEHIVRVYSVCYGISTISLRYFNIFGPRQRPDSPYAAAIPRFAQALVEGRRPTVFGDGSQTRDFTHVANVAHANTLGGASQAPLRGESVNIACGRSCTLLELLQAMAKALGVKAEWDTAPPRVGDVLHSSADVSLAQRLIGYEPVMSFEAGLADAMAYYSKVYARKV